MKSPKNSLLQLSLRLFTSLIGLILLIDAVWLISKGLFNFGIIVPLVFGAVFILLSYYWFDYKTWLNQHQKRRTIWRGSLLLFFLWIVSLALFSTVINDRERQNKLSKYEPSVLLVLGSGTPHGKPSPVLLTRLQKTIERAKAFPDALVVVSGGVNFAKTHSEGQIMGDYLRQNGLALDRIFQEEKSTSTDENIRLSQKILEEKGIASNAVIEIITSDFHTLRAEKIAKHAGFANVKVSGAPTPIYIRYNAWLREYFAFISGWILNEY